jgi:tRNA(Ile2) C34 agmatinyltransferase TiaS
MQPRNVYHKISGEEFVKLKKVRVVFEKPGDEVKSGGGFVSKKMTNPNQNWLNAHIKHKMTGYKDKPCTKCGDDFEPKGPNQKFCKKCRPSKEEVHQKMLEYGRKGNENKRRKIELARAGIY